MKLMLFDKDVIVTSFMVFFGLFLTNLSIVWGVDFVLMNMVKSSKCISVVLLTFFFPPKNAQRSVSMANIVFGLIIFAGLTLFNIKVKFLRFADC